MTNEPENLAAAVTEFAAGHGMTLVPAVPGADGGRAVLFSAGILDLPGFLELARKLGDGALYLRAEEFGADPEDEDVPAHLARYKGQACELRVAFASAGHGLLHFWDHTAPWYQEWLDSEENDLLGADDGRQAAAEEQARLAREIAAVIVADSGYRAALTPLARQRRAEQLIPEGTDRHVGWDAASRAAETARDESASAYQAIWDQVGVVAAELLASPGWQQAAATPGRKRAAEQFLAARAGWHPVPAGLRDELYKRAWDLHKDRGGSGLF
jgi:hypothetical protein